MPPTMTVTVGEAQLEDLIRRFSEEIEEGLRYICHQRRADRGPLDVLWVDSGNALVVGELKVVEDDDMLTQGIDYYDHVVKNVEAHSRIYANFKIDVTATVRLVLIAPSFSALLINRCKWIDIPISLFTFKCIQPPVNQQMVLPVFIETPLPTTPALLANVTKDTHLNFVTDQDARNGLVNAINEISLWDSDRIVIDPIQDHLSLKVSGKVFAHISPRRKFFYFGTYNGDGVWTDYKVSSDDEKSAAMPFVKQSLEQRKGV